MRRGSIVALLVLTVLAAPAVVPAHDGAHTGDQWPLLAEASGAQGWASFAISTTGGRTAFQIHGGPFTSPITLGFALYDGNDKFVIASAFSAYYARGGFKVHSTAPPGGPLTLEATALEYSGPAGSGFTPVVTSTEPGVFKAVIWVAAKSLAYWSYTVRGENATVLRRDSGAGSFIYMTDDFTGTAQAHVNALGGARASVALDKAISIRDRLLGWYLQPLVASCCQVPYWPPPNVNLMSVSTPAGGRDCMFGCSFFTGAENAGPGTYTFHITGAAASPLSSGDDVVLQGVDARLP